MHRVLSCVRAAHFIAWSVAIAGVLAGCSGAGVAEVQNDRSAGVTLERSSVSCSSDPGVACADSVLARPADGLTQAAMLRTVMPAAGTPSAIDRLDHDVLPDGRWRIAVHFKRDLPAGSYAGTVEINVFSLLEGYRAATLSYNFTQAGAAGDLRPLATLAGATDWQTHGGSARHNGAVPVTLDAATFTRRWTAGGTDIGRLSVPVTAAGRAFVVGTRADSGSSAGTLWAIDESTGGLAWSHAFGVGAGAPATDGTRVFVQSSEPGGLALRAFDAANGSPLYAVTTPSPTGFTPARYPVAPWGGTLHAADVGGGAVVTCDAATGAAGWSASLRGSFDPAFSNWAPAVTDTQVFTNVNGRFRASRRSDGAELFSLPVAGPTSGSLQTLHELSQAPVVVDADSVLLLDQRRADGSATANQLTMIDLPTRQVRWTANGHFTAHPVAAGGIVVAGNQQSEQVEVRSATSGAILWTWAPGHADDETIESLLLTDNLLFVSAGRRTHAIDLQTRQSVWSYPLAGQLALSPNGLLYIQSSDPLDGDRLVAINVR